ncbi:MAG: sulfatase [Deltaproteobacteria bacterium]|nr:sulfatase [Deltaproteobacteria bacterium]
MSDPAPTPFMRSPIARASLGRFARTALLVAAPIAAIGWFAGLAEISSRGLLDRALPVAARFALVRSLGPALATGLTIGFWAGLIGVALHATCRDARRERRAFAMLLLLATLVAGLAIARRFPAWKALADSAAYTGEAVGVWFGIVLLGVANFIQATLPVRLKTICVAGMGVTLAAIPVAMLESRIFRRSIPARPTRPRSALAWASAGFLGITVAVIAVVSPPYAKAPLPPIVLISIDTLRRDHMSVYGYERPTTPNLEDLARDGAIAQQFIAAAPWTLPTHASMLTGLSPAQHGLTAHNARLARHAPLVAETLKDRGYRTGAVVTSTLLSPTYGFSSGFDKYEINIALDAEQAADRLRRWLTAGANAPNFVFLHVFDVHYPYTPPPPFLGRFGPVDEYMQSKQEGNFFDFVRWVDKRRQTRMPSVVNRYDESVLYVDHVLGLFFTELKKHKVYDRAWIFVVSDHGEEFFEHDGMGHSVTLYEELVRVPFIVKAPGGACAGSTIATGQIEQIALAAMMLDAATTDPATLACDEATGAPSIVARHATAHPVISETRTFGPLRFAARTPAQKLLSPARYQKVQLEAEHGYQLFDLVADPGETSDLYAKGAAPDLERAIESAFRGEAESVTDTKTQRLDPQTIEVLKSLGYIQ